MAPPQPTCPKSKLRIVKLLPGRPKDVFHAWLDAEGIPEWLCPGSVRTTVAELNPRVGGRFKIIMRHEGVDYLHTGQYLEMDPPRSLVFTWVSDLTNKEPSLVRIQLKKKGSQTELVLTHEKLPDEESQDKHRGGWKNILDELASFLSN